MRIAARRNSNQDDARTGIFPRYRIGSGIAALLEGVGRPRIISALVIVCAGEQQRPLGDRKAGSRLFVSNLDLMPIVPREYRKRAIVKDRGHFLGAGGRNRRDECADEKW
jgi:hypothetical protein